MTTTKKTTRTAKPKAETKPKAEEVSDVKVEAEATTINSQQGYIGSEPEFVKITVKDNTGESVDLVFTYFELDVAFRRGQINTQEGKPALIKRIVAKH